MPRISIVVVAVLALAACEKSADRKERQREAPEPAATAPALPFTWYDVPAKGVLADELAAQAKRAQADGKRTFAYLHADWCPPCKAIEGTVRRDERMIRAFAGTHIVSIDIDAVSPEQIDAHGLVTESIPAFFRLDGSGVPTGPMITGGAWDEDVPANMAPPLAAFFAR